jgi:hypothetical protein
MRESHTHHSWINPHEVKENIHLRPTSISRTLFRFFSFNGTSVSLSKSHDTGAAPKKELVCPIQRATMLTCTEKWWIGGHHREIDVVESPGLDQCIRGGTEQPQWVRMTRLYSPTWLIAELGSPILFFWAAPVSWLLERLTDVPLKLKKRNNAREIEVGLKWMFSLTSCGFIHTTPLTNPSLTLRLSPHRHLFETMSM